MALYSRYMLRSIRQSFPLGINFTQTKHPYFTSSLNQLKVGDVVTKTRTFSSDDVRKFADVTGDENPIHLDNDAARQSRFGACVVHGALTMGLVSGLISGDLLGSVLLKQNVEFPAPLFVGEEVEARVEVTSFRHNIARLDVTCKGQEEKVVLKGNVHVLYDGL